MQFLINVLCTHLSPAWTPKSQFSLRQVDCTPLSRWIQSESEALLPLAGKQVKCVHSRNGADAKYQKTEN